MDTDTPDEQNKQDEQAPTNTDDNPVASIDDDLAEQDTQNKSSEPTKLSQDSLDKKNLPKKSKKPRLIALALIILLGAAAYWWFFVRDNSPKTTTTQSATTQQAQASVQTFTPENVVYAFKANSADPYTIYWKPLESSRTEAKQLGVNDSLESSDVYGQNVAVSISNNIYVSTDSGKTFTKVTNSEVGAQITSLKFSTDGTHIVYGYLKSVGGKNTVKSINLKGQAGKDLFTSSHPVVLIAAWNIEKQKIIYQEFCDNCDGSPGAPLVRDLKTQKVTNLLAHVNSSYLVDFAVSSDFSKAIFAAGTNNTAVASEFGIGAYPASPYTVSTVDLGTNKVTQIATFGAKGEKNANGTLKTRIIHVGFQAGTADEYYSSDNQLYEITYGKPSLTYEADKPLQYIEFVSANQNGERPIIVGTGTDTSNYTLASYDAASKKLTTIFLGDDNTLIFGVTTK